ncbi:MAG TPA: NADH-quinone oxidoreductase subunit N [Ktedonobacteraceae bacterium]|nr:NADH-quinone oxidoreductase subunit N [Ktedonobacteraceae bacterium]
MSFTYTPSAADWVRISPLIVLAVTALLVLMVDLLQPQSAMSNKNSLTFLVLPILSLLGLAGAIIATILLFISGDHLPAFHMMIGSDQGSLFAYVIILSASVLGILLSPYYLKRLHLTRLGEYYALMLLGTIGMMILAAATSFLTVFLGLEMLSLALYILSGFVLQRSSSQESGIKYFLLSSFASGFLLYGIAMTYGATGQTSFAGVQDFLFHNFPTTRAVNPTIVGQLPTFLLIGMGLLIVGFAFKVSAVPFQAWTPDVYEGAPAPITAFMSVGTKAAALIAFARVFDVMLPLVRPDWEAIVLAITILTIIGGNFMALVQSNVKRMLAYSSIANAGYLLIGVVAGGAIGISAILFYLLCYTFMNLGAFGVISVIERSDNTGTNLSEIRGLWNRQPVLAGLLAFFMLALAGFPPMAGFAAKYYMFYAALQSGHPELLILGVLASILGMYYYLRVIAVTFMEKETVPATTSAVPAPAGSKRVSTTLREGGATTATAVAVKAKPTTLVEVEPSVEPRLANAGWTTWLALGIAAAGTLAMGTLLPFWLIDVAVQAAHMMLLLVR